MMEEEHLAGTGSVDEVCLIGISTSTQEPCDSKGEVGSRKSRKSSCGTCRSMMSGVRYPCALLPAAAAAK